MFARLKRRRLDTDINWYVRLLRDTSLYLLVGCDSSPSGGYPLPPSLPFPISPSLSPSRSLPLLALA